MRQLRILRASDPEYAPAIHTMRRLWRLRVSYGYYASAMAGTRHPWLKRTRFQVTGPEREKTEGPQGHQGHQGPRKRGSWVLEVLGVLEVLSGHRPCRVSIIAPQWRSILVGGKE